MLWVPGQPWHENNRCIQVSANSKRNKRSFPESDPRKTVSALWCNF